MPILPCGKQDKCAIRDHSLFMGGEVGEKMGGTQDFKSSLRGGSCNTSLVMKGESQLEANAINKEVKYNTPQY